MDVPPVPHLHHTAIRVGGVAAGMSFIVFVTMAIATRDPKLLISAAGPAAITVASFIMLRRNWLHAEVLMGLAALTTVSTFKVIGAEGSAAPAAIGVVVIVSVGILFVARERQRNYMLLALVALMSTGVLLEGFTADALWIAVSGALSGGIAMYLFATMGNSAAVSDRRYRLLVERMPVPLIEHDWTAVRRWVAKARAQGVTDIEAHLEARPELVSDLAQAVRLRSSNPALIAVARRIDGSAAHGQFRIDRDDLIPFVRREIVDMFNGREPRTSEHRLVGDEGVMWLRFHAAELTDGELPGVDRVITATDVTELKETQAQLAEQVRSKDEFVAAVSHELRTPLTALLGFSEVLMSTAHGLTDDERDMLHHLHVQAGDMSHIVEDLLVAARAEIGNVVIDPKPVNLAELATEIATNLGARIAIRVQARPVVNADRVRVGQILRNLVTNAVRYGGNDRSIYVLQRSTAAIVEVRDDGVGIPHHQRERIFEPYTRAHDRPGMTLSVGLGLAVSRQLAELMGGTLEYQRTPGHSIFRLTFPLAAPRAEVA